VKPPTLAELAARVAAAFLVVVALAFALGSAWGPP
jgi:hypothetical protein